MKSRNFQTEPFFKFLKDSLYTIYKMKIIYTMLICILMFGYCYGTHNFDSNIHHEIQKFHLRGISNPEYIYCTTHPNRDNSIIGCERYRFILNS